MANDEFIELTTFADLPNLSFILNKNDFNSRVFWKDSVNWFQFCLAVLKVMFNFLKANNHRVI